MKPVRIHSSKLTLYWNDTGRKQRDSGSFKLLSATVKVLEREINRAGPNSMRLKLPKGQALELTLTLCGRAKIKGLNRRYRKKNRATDVLSFPLYEDLRLTSSLPPGPLPVLNLGDIFICKEVAKKQAKEFQLSYQGELIHLLIHGFLHLCGFDHEMSAKEERLMQQWEQRLIDRIFR